MFRKPIAALSMAIAVSAFSGPLAIAEEGTVRAFATFEADGSIVRTGPAEATLVGTVAGPVYVETDQGPVGAGNMACAMIVHQDIEKRTQVGNGQCTIKGPKGNMWFISLSCTGVPMVGCAGESNLTGGTGPFENLSGGGRFVVRSNMLELASSPHDEKDKVKGIIFWSNLKYLVP